MSADLEIAAIITSLTDYNIDTGLDISAGLVELDKCSASLAKSEGQRQIVGSSSPAIWPPLRHLWRMLDTQYGHSLESTAQETAQGAELERLIMSSARFTRNLVAGIAPNQALAYEYEPQIRSLLYRRTAYSIVQREDTHSPTWMLIQTLSNIVTANEDLKRRIWQTYIHLPEESNIVIRLLAFPNDKVVASTMIFILNLISGNVQRMTELVTFPMGTRIVVLLLDRIAEAFESTEFSSEDLDNVNNIKSFEIGYNIFSSVFAAGLGAFLDGKLIIADEIVTPQETSFLKLLDAYILHLPKTEGNNGLFLDPGTLSMLVERFLKLCDYAQSSISLSLDVESKNSTPTPSVMEVPSPEGRGEEPHTLQSVDLFLPKVCEALVLVTQCLCTVLLAGENAQSSTSSTEPIDFTALNNLITLRRPGTIESLIAVLRLLDRFLPRIVFGKVLSPGDQNTGPKDPRTGFNYLKRDLVRLLGILGFENREVQDRVRECEGIPVVMNLCVPDDRNPYLREHALFTLRNLLMHNRENQLVVDSIKPTGSWDLNGVLQDTGSVRK